MRRTVNMCHCFKQCADQVHLLAFALLEAVAHGKCTPE